MAARKEETAGPTEMPPIRAPDKREGERAEFVQETWDSQDQVLLQHDKQIEENVRMLSGLQWNVWSDLLNQWVDVSRHLTDDEKRWRQRPVVNRLLHWYMLTHARTTENPPVLSFQPASGDRLDKRKADAMDTIFKTLWRDVGMPEKLGRFMSWVIAAGRGYLKSRVDLKKGPMQEWYGPATVTVETEEGEQEVFVPVAPFNFEQGPEGERRVEPQVDVRRNGEGFEFEFTGDPFKENEGGIAVDVLSPLEVRGAWGPEVWHEKRWHLHKSLLTPEEVYDQWGVEVEPDVTGPGASEAGALETVLYGDGNFGAAGNREEQGFGTSMGPQASEGYVTVYEFWHRPSEVIDEMAESEDSPGGRLLITTPNTVLRDGPRPVRMPYTSPIRKLDFVNIPGRPSGTTPLEMLNPIQRAYNRGIAQIMEHRNLVTNPIGLIDDASGVKPEQVSNRPGQMIKVTKQPNIPPLEYASPPPLSEDVWQAQAMLADEINFLGNLSGAEGSPPTRDPSGELVKELRFNSDRFIGPTMRRAVHTMTRMAEDWMAFLPTIWDREKTIEYAGEDQIIRTITVYPEMFEQGQVDINPEVESMLPQGRGERQQKVYRMWLDGAFGNPASPAARRKFLEMMQFPHMDRQMRPAGTHEETARHENREMVEGTPADEIPVLEVYDHQAHLRVHREFMASVDFRKLTKQKQEAFTAHVQIHKQILQRQIRQQLARQQALAEAGAGGPGASRGPGASQGGNPGQSTGGGGGEGAAGGDVGGVADLTGTEPSFGADHLPEDVARNQAPTTLQ